MTTSLLLLLAVACIAAAPEHQPKAAALSRPAEHDFVVKDFRFQSGETLPEIRLHYRTLSLP